MQDIDEKIRQALSAEDKQVLDEIHTGTGLFELIGLSFKGKQAWMMYYMYFIGFAVFVALLYSAMRYTLATDIKVSLTWALSMIACMLIIAMVKIMGWQQMFKLELLREIKRLEMRIMLGKDDAGN